MPQNDKSDVIPAKKKLDLGLSKREWGEALAGQGASLADELTTERVLHHGGYEADPLARPFTKLPEPAYIAVGQGLTESPKHARPVASSDTLPLD